ncbi:EmrB/QacA subfamily drug resistance transporter [Kribbella amoyensis]|uniref:EmrB/QacA subfamily drug resistance transporter n=1 Tax=Kribbella amoyensis TaxID=996641 RepID=A0A561BLA3_9ACTN|nr:MFS transporter [Kribbella amoyensis]TWD79666.1 EmrB/QacA subfamily drug resistance transporter [Kribbella amoyensis]
MLNVRNKGAILALLAFAQLIIAIDYTIVFVAVPEIGRELGFSAQTLQWVVSGYAVAFGGFLLLGGRMSDLLGRRRMFVGGLFLYGASSLAGGLANSPELLVAARAVQGLGGALLAPATLSLIGVLFAEGRERNRAFSIWGGAGGSGMALGSLLGGVLTQAFGWESVFYVNVPLAAIAGTAAFVLIPRDPPNRTRQTFDVPGAVTATAGITAIVFALVQGPESGWTAPAVLGALVVGAILLAVFVLVELRSPDPLMPLHLLGDRGLRNGITVILLFAATFGPLLYFETVYFQLVHGYSALETGLAYLVPTVAILIGANLGGRLATRFGLHRTLAASLALGALGTALLGLTLSQTASYAVLVPGLVILGLGQGSAFTTMYAAASTGVAPEYQGIGSGMASTGQQVGNAVGLAILVAVANHGTEGRTGEVLRTTTTDGLRTAVLLSAVGIAITAVLAIRTPRIPAAQPVLADAVSN